MGFLSNKIWVRIFLGHPVLEDRPTAPTSTFLANLQKNVPVLNARRANRNLNLKVRMHYFEVVDASLFYRRRAKFT